MHLFCYHFHVVPYTSQGTLKTLRTPLSAEFFRALHVEWRNLTLGWCQSEEMKVIINFIEWASNPQPSPYSYTLVSCTYVFFISVLHILRGNEIE